MSTPIQPAITATELGKQYGKRWALDGCSLEVPAGRVVALVGPNGAGKTTLLHLAAGLLRPSAGRVEVFGGDPARDLDLLPRIGLVAQDMPLYRGLTVNETLRLGQKLNPRWDQAMAIERLEQLSIDLGQKVGTLSGGQRAQVALVVALGKRPELLLLDEPLAALDPLARREFMQTLMQIAADGDLTIVLSSHLIVDLERVCDRLVLVAAGQLQLADDIDTLLASHRILVGPRPTGAINGVAEVIDEARGGRQASMVVRVDGPIHDPRWMIEEVTLEELVLAYLAQAQSAASDRRLHALDAVAAVS
jgi:ABC-2 type transport system ATP-binding protein